jgi:fructose-bisphosphate aldolase class I
MNRDKLKSIAQQLVAPVKGILAVDESNKTIAKRFQAIKIESTEESRRRWRQLLFTTPGIEKFLSGVILFDETIHQKTNDGISFPQFLKERGILPGIKVDLGLKELADSPKEKVTQGLEGLEKRLVEYRSLGASFTKWRAVFSIGENLPTQTCIEANSQALAEFAFLSQKAGLVPIVESEVLMLGNHSLEHCQKVTGLVLSNVLKHLSQRQVFLEGILLKPNMVVSGTDYSQPASPQVVAQATLTCLAEVLPRQIPGCVFLSGGLTPEQATARLNAINQAWQKPCQLSFSFARALQKEALQIWQGKNVNLKAAQNAFYQRLEKVSLARQGRLENG